LKTFLEQRGADGGPWNRLCALPALWVGLLYDDTALAAALDLVKDWTAEERVALRLGAAHCGLKAPFRSGTMQDLAREVLAIACSGLKARARLNHHGEHEAVFLDDLDEIAMSGITPAERLLELYNGPWGGSVEPIFKEAAY
ncbi:MAG: glutamate--cysteine ligase, partial [Oceanicaulis sp.]|nr:glutamate--cysteine ligase [Oceanicaulis sp.]